MVSYRSAAESLDVSVKVVQRLVGMEFMTVSASEVARLASYSVVSADDLAARLGVHSFLRVSLAKKTDAPATDDWRSSIGWAPTLGPQALQLAASGWWRMSPTARPEAVVAVVPGGWIVGAWRVDPSREPVRQGGLMRYGLLESTRATAAVRGLRLKTGAGAAAVLEERWHHVPTVTTLDLMSDDYTKIIQELGGIPIRLNTSQATGRLDPLAPLDQQQRADIEAELDKYRQIQQETRERLTALLVPPTTVTRTSNARG